jgi:hypothetical protein
MWLPWDIAAVVAVVLAMVAAVWRPATPRAGLVAAMVREASIVFALYALWQLVGDFEPFTMDGAADRAMTIVHLQRYLPLPTELQVQHLVLHSATFVQASNVYYAVMHVPAMIAFLVWLFVRHRDRYAPWRNTLALLTGACLLIHFVPVAPPRLMPQLGFVDTAVAYGQSVYGPVGTGVSAQLAAMPSVHVGWAILIAIAVVRVTPSRGRWSAVAHAVITCFVVVATANHWWLDGIAAVAILGIAWVVQDRTTRWLAALRRPAAGPQPVTEASDAVRS